MHAVAPQDLFLCERQGPRRGGWDAIQDELDRRCSRLLARSYTAFLARRAQTTQELQLGLQSGRPQGRRSVAGHVRDPRFA